MAFHGPRRVLRIDGARWMVYLNVHGVRPTARSAKLHLTAVVTIQPPKAGTPDAVGVKPGRWLGAIRRELKRHGYSGGWRDSRWGGSALFFKELPSLHAVQAEVAQMPRYDLSGAFQASKGRRTTRSS